MIIIPGKLWRKYSLKIPCLCVSLLSKHNDSELILTLLSLHFYHRKIYAFYSKALGDLRRSRQVIFDLLEEWGNFNDFRDRIGS